MPGRESAPVRENERSPSGSLGRGSCSKRAACERFERDPPASWLCPNSTIGALWPTGSHDPTSRWRMARRRRYAEAGSLLDRFNRTRDRPDRRHRGREQAFDRMADLAGPKPDSPNTFGTGAPTFGTESKAAAKRILQRTLDHPRLSGLDSGTAVDGTFPNPWIRLHLGCSQRAAIVTSADRSDDSSHLSPWLTRKLPAKRERCVATGALRLV